MTPIYVDTRTELKAVDTTQDKAAILTEADRGGLFVWRLGDYSAQLAADTAEGVYIKADAIASASGAWVRLESLNNSSGWNVLWFGAVGDGATNDTSSIQAAINSGARKITAPPGKVFRTAAPLTVDVSNIELDFSGSTIELNDATGLLNHLFLGNGLIQKSGIKICNITFTRAQFATGGYAIDSDFVGVVEISGCRIYGNGRIYGGIKIYRGIIVNIFNNYIDNCTNYGLTLEGSGLGVNRTVDVSVRENRIEGGVTALQTCDFVEGLFCRDNIFYNTSGSAVAVNASTNANGLFSFKFTENDFDTCLGSGLYIDNVTNVQICDCWFSNIINDALQLKSGAASIIVADNQFYPKGVGIRIEGTEARISGNLISGGTTAINVAGGIRVGITENTLQNCSVAVDLNSSTNCHAHGNFLSGIATGFQNIGSTSRIQGNFGDSKVGTSAPITVAATPFTYTAGARPECVSIHSGTVSAVSVGGNNVARVTNTQVTLAPRQSVTVTYSAVPTIVTNIL